MTPSGRVRRLSATAVFVLGWVTLSGTACRERKRPEQAALPSAGHPGTAAPEATRAILRLHPGSARPGELFNRQPNGVSAIAVVGSGFVRGDKIHWGGQALKTVFGGDTTLTAEVPTALISQPGEVSITVRDPDDPQSMEIEASFRVLASAEP